MLKQTCCNLCKGWTCSDCTNLQDDPRICLECGGDVTPAPPFFCFNETCPCHRMDPAED
jgi:hypothetical protein